MFVTQLVTYVNYVAGTDKGETATGDLFNNPFMLGDVAADGTRKATIDANYTGATVIETVAEAGKVAWERKNADGTMDTTSIGAFGKVAASDAEATFHKGYVQKKGEDLLTAIASVAVGDEVSYVYNNIIIPQEKLPTLKAEMKSIPLIARARRIAIYYSQIAAFQSKTDYGLDLGDQLAQQAVGRLQYEIDTEVTDLLIKMADDNGVTPNMVWSRTLPVGVSKAEHYEGFSEVVEIAKQKVYDATKRFVPNYMLIASDILPILTFIKGFKAASTSDINGPYFAGTLNSIKVFVTPNIEAGKFVVGVNGSDLMSSAAVYAPYLPVVPTQLLQFADGTTSQGFSTMCDLKPLNENLVVSGEVTA